MSFNLIIVLGLLALNMLCFVIKKPRADIVAVLNIILLPLFGLISFDEAISGFSNPVVLIITLMFVISEVLMRTGISQRVGWWILVKSGKSHTKVIVLLMVFAALIGMVMSTTGVVAIFLPIALNLATRLRTCPSRILMPLAYAGIISGMLTLIATSVNLVASNSLIAEGFESFRFFSFTPIGVAVLFMGIIYMLIMQRFLGGGRADFCASDRKGLVDFVNDYALEMHARRFKVLPHSPLVGKKLRDIHLREDYLSSIICIDRRIGFSDILLEPRADTQIHADDILFVDKSPNAPHSTEEMCATLKLNRMSLDGVYFTDKSMEVGMAEIALHPESSLIGKSVVEIAFRSKYFLSVVGLRRNSKPLEGDISQVNIKVGDILLVAGSWKQIRLLNSFKDFLVLNLPYEFQDAAHSPQRAPLALLALGVMVGLMIFGVVPNSMAALITCFLMLIFRCINMEDAYKSVHWSSILLIVGMMPFSICLDKVGAMDFAAHEILELFSGLGARAVLTAIFVLTLLCGLFITNTVNAILMTPLALSLADNLHLSPYPFAMAVAIAATSAFITPISSPVNMLIWEPGRYSFSDFLKMGIPFTFAVMLLSILIIPLLFPF